MRLFALIIGLSAGALMLSACKSRSHGTSGSAVKEEGDESGPNPILGTYSMYRPDEEPSDGCHLYDQMRVYLNPRGAIEATIKPAIDDGCELPIPPRGYALLLFSHPIRGTNCNISETNFGGAVLHFNAIAKDANGQPITIGEGRMIDRRASNCEGFYPGGIEVSFKDENGREVILFSKQR